MRWLILVLAAIPAFAGWAWIVFIGTFDGWWREPLAEPGDADGFAAAAAAYLDAHNRGNAAFRLVESGEIFAEHFVSIGTPVDAHTRFPVASISKWVTAWAVLDRVEAGELALDVPVARYLTRWALPPGPFDNDGVTIRRLLSHTAGLTDDLGYLGFEPGQPLQPLEDSLNRAADAEPGADGRVRVGIEPGSEWRYSGGGYALLQLVLEEVSGEAFADHVGRTVLEPLGMHDSTFELPDGANVATLYDVDGRSVAPRRFTASSAAGLYSSVGDLARFAAAHAGAAAGGGVLEPDTVALLRQPQATAFGTEIWGLGTMLYAENGRGSHLIGHDGFNAPASTGTVRVDPATGDAIVVLATGNPRLTSYLGGEWVFWKTGHLDIATFYGSRRQMFLTIAAGWGVIVLAVLVTGWLTRAPRPERGPVTGSAP